jgi:DNA processing protein
MSPAADLKYWVALNRIPGLGRVRYSLLENHFPSMEEAWRAGVSELKAAGLDARLAARIASERASIDPDAEMERLARNKVAAHTWHDDAYPARLKEIYDRPPLLYIRGELGEASEWCLGVVGTRRPTAYGRQVAEELTDGLARNGLCVVSGLARGIDAIAHRTTLDAGARTVAVLACGLDMVYPREHTALAKEIIERGALISDYPLGTQPRGDYFPRRNRIMSGVSMGVLIVEGDVKSGAMITAKLALEQDREVFAVPGSIFSVQSRGTNWLIQQGAKLVLSVEDVLEELNLKSVPQQMEMREIIETTDTETALLRHISREPAHVDEVCRDSGLPVATVSSVLAMLELKGLVRQMGPMSYVRVREAQAGYGG